MLKKLPLCLFFAMSVMVSFGQTIVSTSPENKNVVLEEFTGINCVFCPQGHAIAKAIQDAHPDDVSLINIHVGSFATPGGGQPDFRTPYGSAIVGQTGLTGYPGGTVNRHVFPGRGMTPGGTAMGRGSWTVSSNEILATPSNVNVAVEASIDVQTNELTVHVEAYYTSNSPESTNLLNVALLQNNTKGPQTGGGQGNNYNHMHRLVEMITGQWGEVINTTTAGTFVDRTYTYTIPADYNGIQTEIADMEVVAFITNTHQELPTGNRTLPEFTGLTNANDANVRYVVEVPDACARYVNPKVNVQNMGQDPITSLDFQYEVNGVQQTYTSYGDPILSLRNRTFELPVIWFDLNATNTLTVTVADDDNNSNNSSTTTFGKAVDATTTVNMVLVTDNYGTECRWNVKDYDGNIIYNGGPYNNNITINETFDLPANCYTFNIIDTYGDGGASVTLTDSDGLEIYSTNGNYGSGESINFSTDSFFMGTINSQFENVSIYPNPASSILNLKNAENANIQVFDVLGKLILSKNNISMDEQINVEKLQAGTYFMKISKDSQVTTKRFIISQ